jgi:hypothetical protein
MVSRKIGAAMSLDRASSAEAFARSSRSKEKRTRIRRVLEGSEEQAVVVADRHPHSPDQAPDKAGGRRKRRRLFRYYDDSDTVAELSSKSRRDPHGCADPQFQEHQSPVQVATSPLRAKSVRQKATPSPSVAACESSDDRLSSYASHLAQLLNEFDSPREAVRALEYTLEQHTAPSWYECVEEDNDGKCNDYYKSRKHCMKRRDDGEIDSDGGSQDDESKDNETRLEVLATFRQQVKEVVSNWMENDACDDGLHGSNSSATLRDLALQVDRCLESMRQSDADTTNALASGAGLHIALPCRRQPRLSSPQADGQSGGSRLCSPPRVVVQYNGNQLVQPDARCSNPSSLVPVVTPEKQCMAASTRDLASTEEKQMSVPARLGSVFFDKPKTGYHLFCREWYAKNHSSVENCAANAESVSAVAAWHALPKRDMEVALFAATKAWTRLLADEKDDFSDRVLVEFPPDPPKPRLSHTKITKNRPINRSDSPNTSSFESRQGVHQSGTLSIHLPESVLTRTRREEGLNELVPVSPNLESFVGGLFSTFHNDATGYVKKPSKQDIRRQGAHEVRQSASLEFRVLLSEGMQLEKIARSYRTSFADDSVTADHDARYNVARRKEGTDSLLFEGINLGHLVTEKSLSRIRARMATLIRKRTDQFESALVDSSETCRVYATKRGIYVWLQLVMGSPARDRGGDETQLPKNSSSLDDETYLAHFPEASDKNRDRAPGSSGHTKCKRLIVMAVHGSPVLVWSSPSLTVYSQQLKSRVLDVLQLALVPSGSSQHSKGK